MGIDHNPDCRTILLTQLSANPPLWNFATYCYRLAGIPCETTSAGYTFYQLPTTNYHLPSFTSIVPEGIAGVGSPFSFELPANLPLAAKIGAFLAAFDVLKTCQLYAMFLKTEQWFCSCAHTTKGTLIMSVKTNTAVTANPGYKKRSDLLFSGGVTLET